jgi:hypothetical protein
MALSWGLRHVSLDLVPDAEQLAVGCGGDRNARVAVCELLQFYTRLLYVRDAF